MKGGGRERVTVYLSLGSNLGDRLANLHEAVERLRRLEGVSVERVSAAYESEPVGVTDQPRFLNLAAQISTTLDPLELLDAAKRIEREMGRQPGPRWGPRLIDIDLLLYGDASLQSPRLTLPHPEMMRRAFVLVPLAEIAPDLPLPGGGTAAQHARPVQREVERHAVLPV
jgi:2-amino-4-hydroxy-6-hydroxymethyldihydropteridine diphosphokinase